MPNATYQFKEVYLNTNLVEISIGGRPGNPNRSSGIIYDVYIDSLNQVAITALAEGPEDAEFSLEVTVGGSSIEPKKIIRIVKANGKGAIRGYFKVS